MSSESPVVPGTPAASPVASARYLGAFFDELTSWGVREVVVSPGSRSTPLSMCAYELSRRAPERLRLFVDIDERGAAFFALGLAKASGRPTALICTSGSAVANYYPAVLEAEASRVPLIVLTGDRPLRLQGLGTPQTCDQLKVFGDHVRSFRQMPLPSDDDRIVAFVRQAAREAIIAAGGDGADVSKDIVVGECSTARIPRLAGTCFGGPIHLNFPFDEPLMPDFSANDLFETGRRSFFGTENVSRETFLSETRDSLKPIIRPSSALDGADAARIVTLLAEQKTLVLAGEGTCANEAEAYSVIAWAQAFDLPLLADPLSGLRSFSDAHVVDNYDTVFAAHAVDPAVNVAEDATVQTAHDDSMSALIPDVVIRFGRWPISKRATTALDAAQPIQIVVDPLETRDFNAMTDFFVAAQPVSFVRSLLQAKEQMAKEDASTEDLPMKHPSQPSCQTSRQLSDAKTSFAKLWIEANDAARERIIASTKVERGFEGAFVHRMVELAPDGSCLFAASSMSVRALDTFYLKADKRLTVLCNRGLNGIDGTVSSALGAAQQFRQTTLLIGDLALLHDLNALALQRELRVSRETSRANVSEFDSCTSSETQNAPSIVIVLLNNNGGGIFDMLPQRSDEPYFERLFLTPQDVNFDAAARAFDVPYCAVDSVSAFEATYKKMLGVPGISLVDIKVPLRGLPERYAACWS